jgi:hypothetical protein
MKEAASQRDYLLHEVFDRLCWFVQPGIPNTCRLVVFQQTQRWLQASGFDAIAHHLRAALSLALDRNKEPIAAISIGTRTPPSTSESGNRAGFDGDKKSKGSKVHGDVDTWAVGALDVALALTNEQVGAIGSIHRGEKRASGSGRSRIPRAGTGRGGHSSGSNQTSRAQELLSVARLRHWPRNTSARR